MPINLVLASKSSRRKELLDILGLPFRVVPPSIEEKPKPEESPEAFVSRMAREKAADVAAKVKESVVLSADTIVTIDGEIFGKPADEEDAVRMLKKLSGREHAVYTAVCVIDQVKDESLEGIDRTRVWFDELNEKGIREYVDREDILDKAGAYAIQGFAAVFIPRIVGNYTNVMGLPMPLVYEFLCHTLL